MGADSASGSNAASGSGTTTPSGGIVGGVSDILVRTCPEQALPSNELYLNLTSNTELPTIDEWLSIYASVVDLTLEEEVCIFHSLFLYLSFTFYLCFYHWCIYLADASSFLNNSACMASSINPQSTSNMKTLSTHFIFISLHIYTSLLL